MDKCKQCDEEILWAMVRLYQGDRFVALNPTPVKAFVYVSEKKDIAYNTDAYIPHWSTCPEADEFREKYSIDKEELNGD